MRKYYIAKLNKLIHRINNIASQHREFFEKNLTSYTYFLLAQSLIVAQNIVWRNQLAGKFGKIPMHTFYGKVGFTEVILSYFIPLIFIYAGFVTFKYPKEDKISWICFNIIVAIFIIFSAVLRDI